MPQDRFEEIFKQRLGEAEVAPSSGLWEKIQGELPPPTPFYRRSSFIAACLGAFLLVSGSIGYFVTNYDIKIVAQSDAAVIASMAEPASTMVRESFADRAKRNYGSFVAKSMDALESAKSTLGVSSSSSKTTSSISKQNTNAVSSSVSYVGAQSSTAANTLRAGLVSENGLAQNAQTVSAQALAEYTYENKSNEENLFASSDLPNTLIAKLALLQSEQSALMPELVHAGFAPLEKTRKGLHIGGFYGYNNTWIVSKNFGLKSRSSNNVNYDIDFGGNYGVALGYDFNNRWGVQTEWVINSVYRQNYAYNWEGSRHLADIKLNYFQFPVLVKYHVAKEKSKVSYLMGLRVARLKSAGLEVNTPSVRVVDVLNTNEVGAIVGMEYAYKLNRHYNFTLGARGSVGRAFNNWSEINDPGKPFNIAFGLRAGLHYNFVK